VYVDLATIHETAAVEGVDLATLPWPDPATWLEKVAASTLTAAPVVPVAPAAPPPAASPAPDASSPVAPAPSPAAPASPPPAATAAPRGLGGRALYLDRYWREERRLAADLRAFVDAPVTAVAPPEVLRGRQREAAEAALSRRLSVIA